MKAGPVAASARRAGLSVRRVHHSRRAFCLVVRLRQSLIRPRQFFGGARRFLVSLIVCLPRASCTAPALICSCSCLAPWHYFPSIFVASRLAHPFVVRCGRSVSGRNLETGLVSVQVNILARSDGKLTGHCPPDRTQMERFRHQRRPGQAIGRRGAVRCVAARRGAHDTSGRLGQCGRQRWDLPFTG